MSETTNLDNGKDDFKSMVQIQFDEENIKGDNMIEIKQK